MIKIAGEGLPIPGEEKRIARRNKVLKDGKIVSMNYTSVYECSVRNISETGARLRCFDPASIPDEFRLLMPADQIIREARVVWRRGDLLGVQFTAEAKKAPPRRW